MIHKYHFAELLRKLEACLKLNEAYEEQYKLTKIKLEQTPKGKQFAFDEMRIFGKFKLFCRRVIKLIDMFSTIDQFNSLSKNKLEGTQWSSLLLSPFYSFLRLCASVVLSLMVYFYSRRFWISFNLFSLSFPYSIIRFIFWPSL